MSDQTDDYFAPALLSPGRHAPDDSPPLEPAPELDTVETETSRYRHDGWTPAARAAFLEILARSGVVTDACREVQRSSQAAYALRNRDPLFAAGWDAAISMARARLADELFHRAVNGTVDQIWRDGAIVAERHRHDNRLSIAVLNRLDARFDRAERFEAPALRVAANWESYLAALAEDRTADMQAMLAPPPLALLHEDDDDPRVWVEDHSWRTSFPPPDGFNGDERGFYGEDDYSRNCTPEERELLDRRYPDAFVDEAEEQRKADEAERDSFFEDLAEELSSSLSRSDGEGDRPRDSGDGGGANGG